MKTIRTLTLALVLLMALAVTAQAQTFDPCAASSGSATIAAGSTPKARWGQPPAENIEAVVVYGQGPNPINLTPLTQVAPVGPCGLAGYEVVLGTFAAGTHSVQIASINRNNVSGALQEGPKSSPFALTAVVPNQAPTAPQNFRVSP
jgi:hypothetical protein